MVSLLRAVADPGPHAGYGPPFERLGPMLIRYSRRKALKWLDERSHRSTDEYDTSAGGARVSTSASLRGRRDEQDQVHRLWRASLD